MIGSYNTSEDLIEKSKTAVQSPFRLEHCLQIAESEYNGAFELTLTFFSLPVTPKHLQIILTTSNG
jgi:hypothetical protein